MSKMKRKQVLMRWVIYLAGMVILAIGLTLNTKTGLGVGSMISVPFSISEIWHLNFGNVTMVVYTVFVAIQMLIHIFCPRSRCGRALKPVLILDVLQLPFNMGFTRIINLVSALVPVLSEAYAGQFPGSFAGRVIVLLLAITCTGVGATMMLNMLLIPGSADGIVQVLAEATNKPVGFTKNWVDIVSICITLILGFAFAGKLVGIGLCTVVAAFGTGRVMALCNRICGAQMKKAAGL